MAAQVLLRRDYRGQEMQEWLDFRGAIFDEAMGKFGKLECYLCGRDDLIVEMSDDKVRQPANLATIDHVQPLSKGGARLDRANCKIACYCCNQRKADKTEEDK